MPVETQIKTQLNAALTLHQQGHLEFAVKAYKAILETDPKYGDALHLLGVALHNSGQTNEGIPYIRQATALHPDRWLYWQNLGVIYQESNQLLEALNCYHQVILRCPNHTEAMINKGNCHKDLGQFEQAIHCFQQAILINPKAETAYNNLGLVYAQLEQIPQAQQAYQTAIKLNAQYMAPVYNLGNLCYSVGQLDHAIVCYKQALAIDPNQSAIHNNLAASYQLTLQFDLAITHFERSIELDPNNVGAYHNLAYIYGERGENEKAADLYQKGKLLSQENSLWPLRADLFCPALYQSIEEIKQFREQTQHTIETMKRDKFNFTSDQLPTCDVRPSFYLTYHGADNRQIKSEFADAISKQLFPKYSDLRDLPVAIKIGQKPKIGFLVTNKPHSVFQKVMQGIIEQLPKETFEVVLICFAQVQARLTDTMNLDGISIAHLSDDFETSVKTVKSLGCNIIHYFEINSDSLNYYLPYFKLAPIQTTSWTIAETTGLPDIDYYLSSKLWETEEAQSHYREKLVLLDTLPVYYEPLLSWQPNKTRADFGFTEKDTLYACPQNPIKLHPDFDAYIGHILEQDPNGKVVFSLKEHPSHETFLRKRFAKIISPELMERITFLPRMPWEDYMNWVSLADVLLDPIHFGAGVTAYETFSVGTPIITYPQSHLRSRLVTGLYKRMGINECMVQSPEAYVQTAMYFAQNKEAQNNLRAQIKANAHKLFEDKTAITALSEFFKSIL